MFGSILCASLDYNEKRMMLTKKEDAAKHCVIIRFQHRKQNAINMSTPFYFVKNVYLFTFRNLVFNLPR